MTPKASGLAAPPPLALYVHWPWCVRKCPYCDFNSHEPRGDIDEAAYLAALIADLEAALPQVWNRPVGSVFIGGGTPSLMSAATADALLAAIRMRLPLHPDAEVTLEANPGTAEAGKFAAFRAAGVTRLSLGVQSFDDAKLAALGRIHDAAKPGMPSTWRCAISSASISTSCMPCRGSRWRRRAATSPRPSPAASAMSRPIT
jgi:coproporphyrinogen III oxidase-like Fe-S oxidoreductase